MTREEAIAAAQAAAHERGWSWLEPIHVNTYRRWLIGRKVWEVMSNAESRGHNVRVSIDDKTGSVLHAHYLKR